MILRNRLRKYRRLSGFSQGEVTAILGLKSATSLSRWERNARDMGTGRLMEFSALYHRTANELLLPQYHAAARRVDRRLHSLGLR